MKGGNKTWQDYGREWLDTFVVAISVAMAFRCYFYEPFNIPTGSMQETLWGNHSSPCEEPGVWETTPLKWAQWFFTGRDYKDLVAGESGILSIQPRKDGRCDIGVVSRGKVVNRWKIPQDAMEPMLRSLADCYRTDNYGNRYIEVRKGQRLWSGYDITGDFIFVNNWWWNFFKPQVGDVMIFATTGIPCIQQGTHYIKRMKATPGQTYVLEHPVPADPRYPGAGKTEVTMGENEYFACGDNFRNSLDSRYWGPVPGSKLHGVGSFVFWPFNGWRKIR